MSGKGFDKAQASPVTVKNKKVKRKKDRNKLESYTMGCFTSDGVFRVLEVEAPSMERAIKKFEFCIKVLELCIQNATEEEIFAQGEIE